MSAGDQFMSPTSDLAIVGVCIVPIFIVVGILAGCETSSGWYADGAWRIGGIVASPSLGDLVDMWSSNDVVSVTAGNVSGMLVRHEKENVGGFHEWKEARE